MWVGPALAKETRVGFVDVARTFDEYQKTKDSDKILEGKGEGKQAEREKRVGAIKKLKEEMEVLSEEGRKKKQAYLDQQLKELQDFDAQVKDELRRERDSMVRDILKEIDAIIREYGNKEGFSMILNDRVLLYGSEDLDITNEIIRVLNERYKKK